MINVAVVYPITVIFQRESRLDRQYVKTFFPELLSKGLPQGEIWMILAGLLVYQQAAVRSEAGHDVDVTFGTVQEVVSPQSFAKPDCAVCSQRAVNACGDGVSVVARVARWVQLYRVSEEHRAWPSKWMPPPSLTISLRLVGTAKISAIWRAMASLSSHSNWVFWPRPMNC